MNGNLKKYDLINDKVDKFLIPILMFLLVVFGRDTLLTNVKYGFYMTQITLVITFLIILSVFVINNRKYILKIIFDVRFFCVLCSFFIIGLQMFVKQDFTLMNFSVVLCIAISFFFTYLKDYKYLLKIFVNCILFLSLYSLIATYCFRGLIFNNLNLFDIITNSVGSEFIDLGLAFVYNKSDYMRNFSIFREPAVFCYFLIISLVIEIFIVKRNKKSRHLTIGIIYITVLTTFSTTGIIVLGLISLLLFLLYFKKIIHNKKYTMYFLAFLFAFIIIAIIIVSISPSVYWTIYSMLFKIVNINDSSYSRFMSIPINFLMFFRSPLFGSKISDVLTFINNNTSTSFSLLATYGLFGVTNIIIWLFFAIDSFKKYFLNTHYIRLFIYLLIVFIPFNTSNILTNVFFYFIPIVYMIDNSRIIIKINYYLLDRLNKVYY